MEESRGTHAARASVWSDLWLKISLLVALVLGFQWLIMHQLNAAQTSPELVGPLADHIMEPPRPSALPRCDAARCTVATALAKPSRGGIELQGEVTLPPSRTITPPRGYLITLQGEAWETSTYQGNRHLLGEFISQDAGAAQADKERDIELTTAGYVESAVDAQTGMTRSLAELLEPPLGIRPQGRIEREKTYRSVLFQPIGPTLELTLEPVEGLDIRAGAQGLLRLDTSPDHAQEAFAFIVTSAAPLPDHRWRIAIKPPREGAGHWLAMRARTLPGTALRPFPASISLTFELSSDEKDKDKPLYSVPFSSIQSKDPAHAFVWLNLDGMAVPLAVRVLGQVGSLATIEETKGVRNRPIRLDHWRRLKPEQRQRIDLALAALKERDDKSLLTRHAVVMAPTADLQLGQAIRAQ